jgi:hypothetical protein
MSLHDDPEVTLSAATHTDRDRYETIEELKHEVDDWKQEVGDWAEAVIRAFKEAGAAASPSIQEEAYKQRLAETARRLVKINGELHAADFAPEWLAEFRGLLLDGLQAAESASESPLDAFDKLLLNIEAMRHLLRDALDGHVEGGEESIAEVVEELGKWLPHVNQAELADLMDVSKRQYQRWASMRTAPSRRAQIVSRLIAILRRSWTPAGVVAWFYRSRPELQGHAPVDVLDDTLYEQELFRTVRQGRAEHGA